MRSLCIEGGYCRGHFGAASRALEVPSIRRRETGSCGGQETEGLSRVLGEPPPERDGPLLATSGIGEGAHGDPVRADLAQQDQVPFRWHWSHLGGDLGEGADGDTVRIRLVERGV